MADEEAAALAEELEPTAEVVEQLRSRSFKDLRDSAVNLGSLVGIWTNCDAETRGIVRIELVEKNGSLAVQVFGACHPNPCDWGQVNGVAYAESVVDNDAVAFTALYNPGFAERIVTGHLDGRTLIVEVFTRFTDGSGRSNYYSREYLCFRRD